MRIIREERATHFLGLLIYISIQCSVNGQLKASGEGSFVFTCSNILVQKLFRMAVSNHASIFAVGLFWERAFASEMCAVALRGLQVISYVLYTAEVSSAFPSAAGLCFLRTCSMDLEMRRSKSITKTIKRF